MEGLRNNVLETYGNKLRIRACGLCRENDRLLMVRHLGLGATGTFWSPPGGGVQLGEKATDTVIREFSEETGLIIDVYNLLFVNEFIQVPLHAIELFFEVNRIGGSLQLGVDPELSAKSQQLVEVRFMGFDEIKRLPPEEVHVIFRNCRSMDELFQLRGYLQY